MEPVRDGAELLPLSECIALLKRTTTGRIAIHVGALPAVVPVGFVVTDTGVVAGGPPDSWFRSATDGAVVAFEADDVDVDRGERWSVVIVGVAHAVPVEPQPDFGPWGDRADRWVVHIGFGMVDGRRVQPARAVAV